MTLLIVKKIFWHKKKIFSVNIFDIFHIDFPVHFAHFAVVIRLILGGYHARPDTLSPTEERLGAAPEPKMKEDILRPMPASIP